MSDIIIKKAGSDKQDQDVCSRVATSQNMTLVKATRQSEYHYKMNESKCVWKYWLHMHVQMSLHACQNWRMKKLIVYFICVTLWSEWIKSHIDNSACCFSYWKVLKNPVIPKRPQGRKIKTIQSNKTNQALWPEYWQDWIVLQMTAAWTKKDTPWWTRQRLERGKSKVRPSESPFCTCLCLWLTAESNCLHQHPAPHSLTSEIKQG